MNDDVVLAEHRLDVPVVRGTKRHAVPFALDQQADRGALHAASRGAAGAFAAQHLDEAPAVEAVEDAPGFLGVDQRHVEVARVGHRLFDGGAVISWKTMRLTGTRRRQRLEQMPADRFTFAVFVGGEIDLAGVLHQRLEFANLRLLLLGHDVERLEVVFDVHPVPRPLQRLVGLRDLFGASRQVTNVPHGRLHEIVVAKEARDGAGLGWGLDDDKGFGHISFSSVGRGKVICQTVIPRRDPLGFPPMDALLHPERPLETFGTIGLILVIFAESGLLVGFFLPGDSLLFTAGLLASQGKLNLAVIVVGCMVAAVVGDQVGYQFGQRVGPALFKREDSRLFKHEYVEKAQSYFDRYGSRTIVLARFIPIVRTFAPVVAGVGKME